MISPKLEICGITVEFQQDVVLNNLSFEVRDGEFLSVLGPSGCGKTTLLRAIAGLTQLQAGTIRKEGKDITNLSPDKRKIGIVFQNYALFENMTALDNVAYALRFHREFRGDAKKAASEILDRVGLSSDMEKYPAQLSGGQQQRTAIGRAIVKNPDILLCDEPTGALDYNTSREILVLIETVSRRYHNTVIMVTHNDAFRQMADHVIVLRDGRIRTEVYNETKVPAAELEW